MATARPEHPLTEFEFFSVAISIVLALGIGRLLVGIAPALATKRRYSVHFGWAIRKLINHTYSWRPLSASLLTLTVAVLLSACGPIMIDHDGSSVFNPAYVGFLESDSRDRWQKPEDVIAALHVPAGSVIADVGAGGGYFTRRFADHVGPDGHVYATDVQEAMIRELNKRVIEKGYENVEIVHSEARDPMLPPGCCDLIFFAAVYKEIQDRNAYLAHVRDALRPNGRVALIGFPPDGSRMGPPKEVRLSVERVVEEFADSGFALTQTHDFLPRQYFLEFELSVTTEHRAGLDSGYGNRH